MSPGRSAVVTSRIVNPPKSSCEKSTVVGIVNALAVLGVRREIVFRVA